MLGRGLESLIPPHQGSGQKQNPPDSESALNQDKDNAGLLLGNQTGKKPIPVLSEPIFHIETEKIKTNPYQPRRHFDEESLRELAVSIREVGILQPLIVSKIEKETEFGTGVEYQLIAGERRLLAARMAGLERVPVIIKSAPPEKEKLEIAIIENLQRADLNPIESARAFARLQDQFGLTQREVASRIGKSREAVANTVRLLNLPSVIQEALAKNEISESQARLLLGITDVVSQENLFKDIINNNLSVRELKNRISNLNRRNKSIEETSLANLDPEIENFQQRLEEFLGTKVKVEKSGQTGKIIITFYSPEELRGIVNKIKPEEKNADIAEEMNVINKPEEEKSSQEFSI